MKMASLSACRACLVTDAPLHQITDSGYLALYENFTNFLVQAPIYLCYECYGYLNRCWQFKNKCARAHNVLTQLTIRGIDITQESLKQIDRKSYYLQSTLLQTQVECISIGETEFYDHNKSLKVENEESQESKTNQDDEEHKYELNETNDHFDDAFDYETKVSVKSDSDNEDDIPLKSLSEKQSLTFKTKKNKVFNSNRIDLGAPEEYTKEIILTKEQQLQEVQERSHSINYLNSPYKCDKCYKGFVDDQAFANHQEKHAEKSGSFVCEICHVHYPTLRKLRTHTFTSHYRRFQCLKCTHQSLTAHQARDHEKWHRGVKYKCKLCDATFRKPTSHLTHLRKAHATEFVCQVCGDSFVSSHGLSMHKSKSIEHRRAVDKSTDPEAGCYCKTCNIQFTTVDAYKKHILTSVKHVAELQNSTECIICSLTFASPSELRRHMKEHTKRITKKTEEEHDVKPEPVAKVTCDICGSHYPNKWKLKAHIRRIHMGVKYNKNLVCEVCGKHCKSNATLKYHQRIHTGERPYPCTECPKRFIDNNQLRIHSRTHSGEKPYACDQCARRFRQRPALTRHMRVHTGAKPYACQYCTKTFTQSNSLKLHIRTVHLKLPPNRKKTQNPTPSEESKNIVILNL